MAAMAAPNGQPCLGEFEWCGASSGACVMFAQDCNVCKSGEYICPDRKTCVPNAEAYKVCPGIKGTHLDWTLPLEQRLDYLASNTDLAEQIAQLTNDAPAIERLFIPHYNWLNDDEHGVRLHHATSFPNGCALGATWDAPLLRRVGQAIAVEARGLHNGFVHAGERGKGQNGYGITIYAPNMNLVRDPRWGRAQEVYSEDPRLSSELTENFVSGAQGPANERYLLTGACCKHYAAYDLESIPTTRYNFSASVNVRNMWETYLPVFHACVVKAQGTHVMCSYNSINGIPTCGDPSLLNGILRDQWNWPGFVVSDYDAWANIKDTHYYCPDYVCAAAVGLNAGLDQEGGGTTAIKALPRAIVDKLVNSSSIATAFKRLFRVRILLGMLDPPTLNPYNFLGNGTEVVESQTHLNLARTAAQKAICLYKNAGNVLPVPPTRYRRIALIGPQMIMTMLLLGNYAERPDVGIVSIRHGFQNALNNTGTALTWKTGCATIQCDSTDLFSEAIQSAKEADIVFVSLGLDQSMESEGNDRADIDLPKNQYVLVSSLRAAIGNTKPLVGILVHGGTVAMKNLAVDLTAILDAWYPGMEGGNAIADVVFGKVNPAGRTAVTYYKDTAQLPPMGNMDLYAFNGTTYRYFNGEVVYPFGYGLSYTSFSYSQLVVYGSTFDACDRINVSVAVTNIGDIDGEEVVQLYVQQPQASVPAPNIRLAAFARVKIPAKRSISVQLSIAPGFHSVVLNSGDSIYSPGSITVEQGPLEIYVGGGQPQYYAGHVSASVSISNTRKLVSCAPASDPLLL